MNKEEQKTLFGSVVAIGIGMLIILALTGGEGSDASFRTVASIIGLAFVIQWIAFIPAWVKQTEHFYDLVGGSSFIAVAAFSLLQAPFIDLRSGILFSLVVLWAGRLATFLFIRVRKAGSDQRFDQIKQSLPRFLFAWTAQGLWISFTLAPAVVALLQPTGSADIFLFLGLTIWLMGFLFELVADIQKFAFKNDPKNKGQFIRHGLWSISRHPNYFGEITLWVGVAIIALPTLSGFQYGALLSPVFIFLLLNYISGVPMLEKRADEKWGHLEAYQTYKERTPVLFPKLFG